MLFLIMLGNGFLMQIIVFQSSDDSLLIIFMDSFSRFRIYSGQLLVEGNRPLFFQSLRKFPSDYILFFLIFFLKVYIIEHGLNIEAGTSHQNGKLFLTVKLSNFFPCHLLKKAGIIIFRRIKDVQKMVGNSLLFFFFYLTGTDIKSFVNLN